jgi:hypothetical protein
MSKKDFENLLEKHSTDLEIDWNTKKKKKNYWIKFI